MEKQATRGLMRDKRGAVLVEFVIAITPVLMTFLSFVQLSKIATARLVLKHSAIVGARGAAVITNGNKNTPDQKAGSNQADVEQGVRAALGPWSKSLTVTNVQITDSSSRGDPYNWVQVEVTATYNCRVPMGKLICASLPPMKESFRMPHQGAIYSGGAK